MATAVARRKSEPALLSSVPEPAQLEAAGSSRPRLWRLGPADPDMRVLWHSAELGTRLGYNCHSASIAMSTTIG